METINYKNNNNNDNELSSIIVTDENNQTHEGKIIFSFEENGDEYVIYELKDQVFGAKVDNNNNLTAINDDEWPLVEKIYNQYLNDNEDHDKLVGEN